jgi:hypothetical protein
VVPSLRLSCTGEPISGSEAMLATRRGELIQAEHTPEGWQDQRHFTPGLQVCASTRPILAG